MFNTKIQSLDFEDVPGPRVRVRVMIRVRVRVTFTVMVRGITLQKCLSLL